MKVYSRITKQYEIDKQYRKGVLNYLYNTKTGRILLKIVINPFYSKICGLYNI